MTLPALNWRRLPAQALGANTVEEILNAIYTAGQSATYADGEARTPGTGSAWTYDRFQNGGTTEAVYATPPTGDVDDLRIIWAGVDGGAPTPTMRTPAVFAAGDVLVSINKNSGAFNAWDNALPFTSGQFFGYWGGARVGTLTFDTIDVYESQEAIVVYCRAGDVGIPFIAGCIVDSGSTQAADSEDGNGRVFGVLTSDTDAALNADFLANNGFSHLLSHSTFNNESHSGFFNYGAVNTIRTAEKGALWNSAVIATSKLPSGSPISAPVVMLDTAAAKNVIGVLRMQGLMSNEEYLEVINDSGGIEAAFLITRDQGNQGNCLVLYK